MNRPIPGLLFDLWNTLLTSDAPVNPIVELGRLLRSAGAPDWLFAIEQGMMLREYAGIEAALPSVEEAAGVSFSPEQRNGICDFWRETSRQVFLFPDVLPALDRLRAHCKLGLLSNTQSFDLDFVASRGVSERMDVIRYSWLTGFLKPDPRSFADAVGALGLKPEEVMMIGDNWRDDVVGARGAGLTAVLMSRGAGSLSHREPPHGEIFIKSLPELESLLSGVVSSG